MDTGPVTLPQAIVAICVAITAICHYYDSRAQKRHTLATTALDAAIKAGLDTALQPINAQLARLGHWVQAHEQHDDERFDDIDEEFDALRAELYQVMGKTPPPMPRRRRRPAPGHHVHWSQSSRAA